MKIGTTGASGFVGSAITEMAVKGGHTVVGFSRNPGRKIPGCQETRLLPVGSTVDLGDCNAIIHLAGENVFGLWTPEKKKRILESRQAGTRTLVNAILKSSTRPEVLVSASAIGFYGDTGQEAIDENGGPGSGFLAEVAQIWEREAQRAAEAGVRVVLLRIAIVLGKGGGAMGIMEPVFRMGLGGKVGNGQQWMSWIHRQDLCRLALFAVENREVTGPLNASAPEPIRNADFTQALARAVERPAIFGVPAFLLKTTLGEFSRELLDSKRIIPKRPLEYGFRFDYPQIRAALAQICGS